MELEHHCRHCQTERFDNEMLSNHLIDDKTYHYDLLSVSLKNFIDTKPLKKFQLISETMPIKEHKSKLGLWRLSIRANNVRLRASNLQIKLDENRLRTLQVACSKNQLMAMWTKRSSFFPDANNLGLLSLMERNNISEDDLIILLSAQEDQFKTANNVINECKQLANDYDIDILSDEELANYFKQPRLRLYQLLDERIEGFAELGHEELDQWTQQYRFEKRIPFCRLLVLLSIPNEHWIKPPLKKYSSRIIDFFHKKVSMSILQGPLVRMNLGRFTPRIDLNLLGTASLPSNKLLDHILTRQSRQQQIDIKAVFETNELLEIKLRNLFRTTTIYQRDTGIDSLYMGFPFLVYQETSGNRLPRIAPLLLWPIKMNDDIASMKRLTLAFDRQREEIRINPALKGILGKTLFNQWKHVFDDLLLRSTLNTLEVMNELKSLGQILSIQINDLPTSFEPEKGKIYFACSAVLFDANFIGQSIGEELSQLKKLDYDNTALETALKLKSNSQIDEQIEKPDVQNCFFSVASDPSQENAVLQARLAPGLLIEGPPGTGKSQTIVNMVGDAIGRHKTVLIVCQKKAALEVVHKRLTAEGLDTRSIMINDINADRSKLINSIRQQLDLLDKNLPSDDYIKARIKLAKTVTKLEAQLDQYDEALYTQQTHFGLSYRELIADLIKIANNPPKLTVPELGKIFQNLDVKQLSMIKDQCSPLLSLWLPAKFEHSPLSELTEFSNDPITINLFNQSLTQFIQVEHVRTANLDNQPIQFDVDDPLPHQQWLKKESEAFLKITENLRERLLKWLPLFKIQNIQTGNLEGDRLINGLKFLQNQLSFLNSEAWCHLSQKFCYLEPKILEDLLSKARKLITPNAWYKCLSLQRYLAKKGLFNFLAMHGEEANINRIPMLYESLLLESEYRPIRKTLLSIFVDLQLPQHNLTLNLDNTQYLIEETLSELEEVKAWADKIHQAPYSQYVEQSLLKSSDAFQDLINEYEAAFVRYQYRQDSEQHLSLLNQFLNENLYQNCLRAIVKNQPTPSTIDAIYHVLPSLKAYQSFRKEAIQLSETALEVLAKLRPFESELALLSPENQQYQFRQLLDYEAKTIWKLYIEQENPILQIDQQVINQTIEQLKSNDEQLHQLNKQLLLNNIKCNQIADPKRWEGITRLTGQRAKRLREFIEQGIPLGLMYLRPIWLMNPDTASRLLPLKAGLFDLVIYDEASQMPIEYAIPTLYRGKIAIVSGDDKQMPPTTFFGVQTDADIDEEADDDTIQALSEEVNENPLLNRWNLKEIMDCPDLLQLSRTVLPTTYLQIHYRSAYRELINYSNTAFYHSQLNVPVRHSANIIKQIKPLEYIWVNGLYEDQRNYSEAIKVVEMVDNIWKKDATHRPSIGVVTFNKKQADLIEKCFYEKANLDKKFSDIFEQENQRFDQGEDVSIFIKNVENVQGDERDVIIFSTTFGRNKQGIFRRNFGILGQQGGERRLNVAITRARQKVILISSMPIEDVSDALANKRAPTSPRDYLQYYLAYSKALSEGNFTFAELLLNLIEQAHKQSDLPIPTQHDDGLLDDVETFIRSLNLSYSRHSGSGVFTLDFTIEDPSTKLYCIGIECDAPIHPLLSNARYRNIWRQSVLSRTIPHIFRLSSRNWYENNDHEKQRLQHYIENILGTKIKHTLND